MEKYYLPANTKMFLNTMIKHVTQILDKHGITYFADGGTLLGAVRHNGQIPWDDDIDLGVIGQEDFFIKLPKALEELHLMGYSITHPDPFLVKIYIANEHVKVDYRLVGTPALDIFCWEQTNDQVRLMSLVHRNTWPECYHQIENFYPIEECNFDGVMLKKPAHSIGYLERMYPYWDKYAVIDIRGLDGIKKETITFDLSSNEQISP